MGLSDVGGVRYSQLSEVVNIYSCQFVNRVELDPRATFNQNTEY